MNLLKHNRAFILFVILLMPGFSGFVNGQAILFGLTSKQENNSMGNIFSLDKTGRNLSNKYNFYYENAYPGGVIKANNGKLYGGVLGNLFEYDLQKKTYQLVADFEDILGLPSDVSSYTITQSVNGKIYGTYHNNTESQTILFEYDISTHAFSKKLQLSTISGVNGSANLVQTSDGKIYGISQIDNSEGLFEYNPFTNAVSLMKDFGDYFYYYNNWSGSNQLVVNSIDKIYGIKSDLDPQSGILYTYDTHNHIYEDKHSFNSYTNGYFPNNIVQTANGKIYGTTLRGGTNDKGVLFEFDTLTNVYTKILSFDNVNGYLPGSMILNTVNGKLYGTTRDGGAYGAGAFFEYDPLANVYSKKFDFDGNNGNPYITSLIQNPDGTLYIVLGDGGSMNVGVLLRYDPFTNGYTKLFEFDYSRKGSYPHGSLVYGTDSIFYGVTNRGGFIDKGVLFSFNPKSDTYTKQVDFDLTLTGANPYGNLIQATDGKFYGMASAGGSNDQGTLFSYEAATNVLTKKQDFIGSSTGANPYGSLLQAPDDFLYGFTSNGGSGYGTLFSYNTIINSFPLKRNLDSISEGSHPKGSLILAFDGLLYGLTSSGGSNGKGTIVSYNYISNTLTNVFNFNTLSGINPTGSLTLANNLLYGMTSAGGANGFGTLFSFNPVGNVFTTLVGFDMDKGCNPMGSLRLTSNGKLYGMTNKGGDNNLGTVFEFDPFTNIFTKTIDFDGNNGSLPTYGNLVEICLIPRITLQPQSISTCVGSAFRLNITATGGPSYQWYANNQSITGAVNALLSVAGALPGNTLYYCKAINECGTVTSLIVTVTGNALPTVVGTALPNQVCIGNSVTISGSGAPILSVSGNIGLGTAFVPTISGIYTISGTDANQCKNSAIVNVTVNSLPILTIAGTSSICPGTSANLTASGANTYNWNNGLFTTSGISTLPETNTTFSVTGTDIHGCTDTAQFTLMVNSLFLTSPGSNMGACACYPAILSVNAVGPAPIQYQWYENEILITGALRADYETPAVDASGKIYKCVVSSLCETITTVGTTVNIDCVAPTESEWIQAGCKFSGSGNIGKAQQGISTSVSADGQTAIVGGYSDDANNGAAWIFTFNGSTFKQSGNKLVGNGDIGSSRQGSSVNISADGKTAIVGGSENNNGNGAVWIYTFNGTSFAQVGNKLVGTGAIGAAQQGKSVSISSDGTTAVVGGHADNNYTGAIWIYTFNGSSFVQLGNKIVGSDGKGALNYQGYSVDISSDGKTIVTGGLLDDSGTGAVWVYTFNGYSFEQAGPKLKGKDATGNPQQGASVGISGDGKTIISGGYLDNSEEGATWIFTFDGANYTQMGNKLVGSNSTGKTQQGVAVDISIDGKIAVVGGVKDGYLINNIRTGATWIYTFNGISFVQTGDKLVGTGNVTHSLQGISVSASEDAKFILTGGYGDDEGTGAVWAFVNPNFNCKLPIIKSDTSEIRICKGAQAILSVSVTGSGLLKYDWFKDGLFSERKYANDNKPVLHSTNVEGNYICVVSNSCGTVTSAPINVSSKPLQEISLDLSSINNLCDTLSPIPLTGGLPDGGFYWYNNVSVTSLNTSHAGDYSIMYRYTDRINCIYTISGILTSIHCTVPGICERPIVPCQCTNTCPPRFHIYSGITPNGDGQNDFWIIDSLYAPNQITILDKWGNEMFHTENYLQDWAGKDNNEKQLPAGIYYYMIEIGPDKKRIPGTVSIIR